MLDKTRLICEAKTLGVDVTQEIAEKFEIYCDTLVETNKKFNLTSIIASRDIEIKHLLDSLSVTALPEMNGKIADVGTGAGFPGAIIAMVKPSSFVTMIDATQKKLGFIHDTLNLVGIDNFKTVHGRAEQLSRQKEYRETFDVVTARAVANLSSLAEYCLPLVKVGGYFIAMKGSEGDSELLNAETAIKKLGGELSYFKKLVLPDDQTRFLLVIKKISQTSTKFPRNSKNITKNPLE